MSYKIEKIKQEDNGGKKMAESPRILKNEVSFCVGPAPLFIAVDGLLLKWAGSVSSFPCFRPAEQVYAESVLGRAR